MGLADLHMHTIYSWDGTATVAAVLKQASQVARLDVIAITDHDHLEGAKQALELAPQYGIEVIPGCEISTAEGHLLAYFIKHPVPPGLPLATTVLKVGEQGGLCVAAHPAARMANSLSPKAIIHALRDPDVARILVGIEVYNAGVFHRRGHIAAHLLSTYLPVARVGNSDAHLLWMIGRGATQFPGYSAQELRQSLLQRTTVVVAGPPCRQVSVIVQWVTHYVLKQIGLVNWNAGPGDPIRYGRPAPRLSPTGLGAGEEASLPGR